MQANSLAWKRLKRMLSMGCAAYEAPAGVSINAYHCPNVSQSPTGNPFSDIHIIGEGGNVRRQLRSNSQVVGVLSNELVKFDSAGFERLTKQQKD